MVGIAVGQMGMSLGDTYSLTLDELAAIHRQWLSLREADHRDRWERTRFLAHCTLSPYRKKGRQLRPTDIVRFPWDKRVEAAKAGDIERMKRKYGED